MIIHQPEINRHDGYEILSARIETSPKPGFFPQYLWYRVPEEYAGCFTTQSDPFLINLLLAAMHYNENIEVQGRISPILAYHLEEYIHLVVFRFPERFQKIDVKYDRLQPVDSSPTGVGSTFSGGVDSMFTVWKHLPHNQPDPDYQVTHGIFLRGFDLVPGESPQFDFLYEKYQQQTKMLGIELIPLETNMFSATHKRMPSPIFYAPTIISAAVSLSGLLRRFYLPSSRDYEILQRRFHASNPLMDRLLSTDTLEIINHGTSYRRVDKTMHIADWEVAQKLLWVCEAHEWRADTWNCSRCEKCVRSMIPLYALNKMHRFVTFYKPLKSDRDALWWARKFNMERIYISETFQFVKENRPGWLPWLVIASVLGILRYFLFVRFIPDFVKQWLRRYGYFVLRNEAPDAYESPEITKYLEKMNDHPPA